MTDSGLHLHMSLTSGGAPVFPADDDKRGLGLSETAYAFVGGSSNMPAHPGRWWHNGQLLTEPAR